MYQKSINYTLRCLGSDSHDAHHSSGDSSVASHVSASPWAAPLRRRLLKGQRRPKLERRALGATMASERQSITLTQDYSCSLLPAGEYIRILELLPGATSDPIYCHLNIV